VDHNDKNDVDIDSVNNIFDFSSLPLTDSKENLTNSSPVNYFEEPLNNIVQERGNNPVNTDNFSEIAKTSFADEIGANKKIEPDVLGTKPEINQEQDGPNGDVFLKSSNVSQVDSNQDFSDIRGRIFQIEVDKIVPNTQQPRQDFNNESLWELASSIKEYGILEPLVVSRHEEETEMVPKFTIN